MGVSINGGTPYNGWFIMDNPTKMDDDSGVPLFQETPSYQTVSSPGGHDRSQLRRSATPPLRRSASALSSRCLAKRGRAVRACQRLTFLVMDRPLVNGHRHGKSSQLYGQIMEKMMRPLETYHPSVNCPYDSMENGTFLYDKRDGIIYLCLIALQ